MAVVGLICVGSNDILLFLVDCYHGDRAGCCPRALSQAFVLMHGIPFALSSFILYTLINVTGLSQWL